MTNITSKAISTLLQHGIKFYIFGALSARRAIDFYVTWDANNPKPYQVDAVIVVFPTADHDRKYLNQQVMHFDTLKESQQYMRDFVKSCMPGCGLPLAMTKWRILAHSDLQYTEAIQRKMA